MERILKLYRQLLAVKFVKFFLSGGTAFLVDTGVLLGIKFIILGGTDILIFETVSVAKLVSSIAGITFMFFLSRTWVFSENKEKNVAVQGGKYLGVTIANLLIANILFGFFLTQLNYLFSPEVTSHLGVMTAVSNLLTEAVKMFISFFAYKYLVFR